MAVSVIPTLDLERAIAEQGYDVIVGFDEVAWISRRAGNGWCGCDLGA